MKPLFLFPFLFLLFFVTRANAYTCGNGILEVGEVCDPLLTVCCNSTCTGVFDYTSATLTNQSLEWCGDSNAISNVTASLYPPLNDPTVTYLWQFTVVPVGATYSFATPTAASTDVFFGGDGNYEVRAQITTEYCGVYHSQPVDITIDDCCGNGELDYGEQCDYALTTTGCCQENCTYAPLNTPCDNMPTEACTYSFECDGSGNCVSAQDKPFTLLALQSQSVNDTTCATNVREISFVTSVTNALDSTAGIYTWYTEVVARFPSQNFLWSPSSGTATKPNGTITNTVYFAGSGYVHFLLVVTDPCGLQMSIGYNATRQCCGNYIFNTGEACDDGNTLNTDYCSANCSDVIGYCGDSIIQSNEFCDPGIDLCCGGNCLSIVPSTVVCRPSVGACDKAENCTGMSPYCPADTYLNSSVVCRGSIGVCDAPETCTGYYPLCPSWNAYYPPWYVCHWSAGVCDMELLCTGFSPSCPAPHYSTELCRPQQGQCDLPEYCANTGPNCPTNLFANASVGCRVDGTTCERNHCSGTSDVCVVGTPASCQDLLVFQLDDLPCMVGDCSGPPDYTCAVTYIQADSCLIDGACYTNNEANPYNPCQLCNNTIPIGTPGAFSLGISSSSSSSCVTPFAGITVWLPLNLTYTSGTDIAGWIGTGKIGFYTNSQFDGTTYTVPYTGYYQINIQLYSLNQEPPEFVVNGVVVVVGTFYASTHNTLSTTLLLTSGDLLTVRLAGSGTILEFTPFGIIANVFTVFLLESSLCASNSSSLSSNSPFVGINVHLAFTLYYVEGSNLGNWSISNSTIYYTNAAFDLNTGVFTAPQNGYYSVQAQAQTSLDIELYVDSILRLSVSNTGTSISLTDTVFLVTGDTLALQFAANGQIYSHDQPNTFSTWLSIVLVGSGSSSASSSSASSALESFVMGLLSAPVIYNVPYQRLTNWTVVDDFYSNYPGVVYDHLTVGSLILPDGVFTVGVTGVYIFTSINHINLSPVYARINGNDTDLILSSTDTVFLYAGTVIDFVTNNIAPNSGAEPGYPPNNFNSGQTGFFNVMFGFTLVTSSSSSSSSGLATVAFQGISVYLSSSYAYTANTPIDHWIGVNLTGYYTNSYFNGSVYTIPTTGHYYINVKLLISPFPPITTNILVVVVNNVQVAISYDQNGYAQSAQLTTTLLLNAGDQLWLTFGQSITFDATAYGVVASWWTITLAEPLVTGSSNITSIVQEAFAIAMNEDFVFAADNTIYRISSTFTATVNTTAVPTISPHSLFDNVLVGTLFLGPNASFTVGIAGDYWWEIDSIKSLFGAQPFFTLNVNGYTVGGGGYSATIIWNGLVSLDVGDVVYVQAGTPAGAPITYTYLAPQSSLTPLTYGYSLTWSMALQNGVSGSTGNSIFSNNTGPSGSAIPFEGISVHLLANEVVNEFVDIGGWTSTPSTTWFTNAQFNLATGQYISTGGKYLINAYLYISCDSIAVCINAVPQVTEVATSISNVVLNTNTGDIISIHPLCNTTATAYDVFDGHSIAMSFLSITKYGSGSSGSGSGVSSLVPTYSNFSIAQMSWTNAPNNYPCFFPEPRGVCSASPGRCINGVCVPQYLPSDYMCRAPVDDCDVPEYCTGSNDYCPQDTFQPPTFQCHTATGVCDTNTTCTGYGPYCPTPVILPSTTVCRPPTGPCDMPETCNGVDVDCPADTFKPSSVICQPSLGPCMTTQYCPGNGPLCLITSYLPNSTICRQASNLCDLPDHCTGVSPDCPPDILAAAGILCRPAQGGCDANEYCTGHSTLCPQDQILPYGTICHAINGSCDAQEICNGWSPMCPPDTFQPYGTQCHTPASSCDAPLYCLGNSSQCPPSQFQPPTFVCHVATSVCDVTLYCENGTGICPAPQYQPSTVVCRAATGACDIPENCTGSNTVCPADVKEPSGTLCHLATGLCDNNYTCNGVSGSCPTDTLKSAGTVCGDALGTCASTPECTGVSADCPASTILPNGTLCHTPTGGCDLPQYCDGVSDTCPSDVFAPEGTLCFTANSTCETNTTCTGNSSACPAENYTAYGTNCSLTGLACIVQYCNGGGGCVTNYTYCNCIVNGNCSVTAPCLTGVCVHQVCQANINSGYCFIGGACYPNGFVNPLNACQYCNTGIISTMWTPSTFGAPCTSGNPTGVCSLQATCDGGGVCVDHYNVGAVCHTATGICDINQTCTNGNPYCPASTYAPNTTICHNATTVCDVQLNCTGSSPTCPSNVYAPASKVCRTSTGDCDPPEYCPGHSLMCPADTLSLPGSVCHVPLGPCDKQQVCNGLNGTCPSPQYQPPGFVCHPSDGPCDQEEVCTGASIYCPADVVLNSSMVCVSPSSVCQLPTYCNGINITCPAVTHYAPSSTICHSPLGSCDTTKHCTGSSTVCPAPTYLPLGTQCTIAAGVCGLPGQCTGASPFCPSGQFVSSNVACRPAVSACDITEYCTGLSALCPPNVIRPDGYPCSDNNFCNGPEACLSGTCVAGEPVNCSLGTGCSIDVCSNQTHQCIHTPPPNLGLPCYTGPAETLNVGICHAGVYICLANSTIVCHGEQTPLPYDICGDHLDDTCSGIVGEGCTNVPCTLTSDCAPYIPSTCQQTGYFCDVDNNCVFPITGDYCAIAGTCYVNGTQKPGNPCQQCINSINAYNWTIDDNVNVTNDNVCDGVEQCRGGQIVVSPSALQCVTPEIFSCSNITCDPVEGCVTEFAPNGTECTIEGLECSIMPMFCEADVCLCLGVFRSTRVLSPGTTSGIIIAIVLGVLILMICFLFYMRTYHEARKSQQQIKERIGQRKRESDEDLARATKYSGLQTTFR